jgi:hypothetical protein
MPTVDIKTVLEAARTGEISKALAVTGALLQERADCPYLLVLHARLIQLEVDLVSGYTLADAEASLPGAHQTDPSYLPALEDLAHYYDAVDPDPVKARDFAAQYIEKNRKILEEMEQIIDDAHGGVRR